jgi:hypothetical protein
MNKIMLAVLLLIALQNVQAESPVIVDVKVQRQPSQLYNIAVTLKHADTGWEHFANEWHVEVDGEVIATRTLHHPHVNEQPFTRSLRNVYIPQSAKSVKVYAKCNEGDQSVGFVMVE